MKSLFGTDGVRGIAGQEPLTPRSIRKLGASAAAVYRKQVKGRKPFFLLGRDTRGSGPWMSKAFAEGAATQKVRVVDLGVTSTPSLAYLVPAQKALGGAMISASHNPAEFNGIKLFSAQGTKCPDAWEILIEKNMLSMADVPAKRVPLRKDFSAVKDYLRFLKKNLPPKTSFKGLKLVVDCSHGSLSKIAPAFLKGLGIKVIAIGASPNGNNINAGWGSQHPEKMQREVLLNQADGGLAFDGDADRIILCDEHGHVLDGDYVIACAARILQMEKRLPGNRVVVTVMANLGLMKALKSWGIQAEATPVGDRYVSEKLDACGGAIGGEQSGHIIFHKILPTGDGLLTGLQILSMLSRLKQPMSWIHSLVTKYPQVLLNLHVKKKTPVDQCPTIQAAIRHAESTLGDDGRVLVRYSGTEPLLRIMMEGPREDQLKELTGRIAAEAEKFLCR